MRHGDPLMWRTSYTGHPWLESDNEFGIPTLDPSMQATEPPIGGFIKWGTHCREAPVPQGGMGVHFYCEDYKFGALWSYPTRIADLGYDVSRGEKKHRSLSSWPA
jgi:hypothetical protein